MNRRSLIFGGAAATGIVLAPKKLFALTSVQSPSPLSLAVVATWTQAVSGLYNALASGRATGITFQAVATVTETLFANMQETGWNDYLKQHIPSNVAVAQQADVNKFAAQLSQGLAKLGFLIPAA